MSLCHPGHVSIFNHLVKICYLSFRRELGRRLQIHDQLRRARRLYASLAEAADLAEMLPSDSPSSYPRAMSILQSAIPDINRLVRLTEAIRGNQMMRDPERDYDSWNEWMRTRNKMEEEQRLRDQRTLRRQLREFAIEKNPVIEVDEELERWHDSLITKPECDGGLVAGGGGDYDASGSETSGSDTENETNKVFSSSQLAESNSDVGGDTDFTLIRNFERKSNMTSATREVGISENTLSHADDLPLQGLVTTNCQDKSKGGEFKEHARKRPPESAHELQQNRERVVEETKTTSAGHASDDDRKMPPPKIAHEFPPKKPHRKRERVVQEMNTSAVLSASPPTKKSAHAVIEKTTVCPTVSPKPIASMATSASGAGAAKKCHDCKKSTSNYRSCHYWTLTGKCKKKYCVDCLSSKYPLTMGDAVSDLEWHCPSCLGTCVCKACIVQRQKEEERESRRNEAERKSSRRSAAGSSYSFFF